MSTPVLSVHEYPVPIESRRECRVYERQACEVPTACLPASVREMKETPWKGLIADISQEGVRLKLQRRFEKGTGLAIELPGDGEQAPSTVFAKVVHMRRYEDGDWMLGCKFLSELSEEQLQRLTNTK